MDFLVKCWGVIVGASIVIAIIDAIFKSAKLLHHIALFLPKVWKWVHGRWRMFREQRLIRQYLPSCKIYPKGKAKITRVYNKYYIELTIEIAYIGIESRDQIHIDCSTLTLDMLNKKEGVRKHPYGLNASADPKEWILELGEQKKEYTFSGLELEEPFLDDITQCKVKEIGVVVLGGIRGKIKLKKKDAVFIIPVYFENEVSR